MNSRILQVDDDESVLEFYKDNVGDIFDLTQAMSGKEGLKIIEENLSNPFPVIVSDCNMPVMTGIQFLSEVRKICPTSVRIMLTANSDLKTAVDALAEGNIFRFLTKPCNPAMFQKNVNDGIALYNLITAEKNLLQKTLLGSVGVLIDVLSVVSPEIFTQAMRLRTLAKRIISRLNLGDSWELEIGVLLSQIGCVSLPKEIINKRIAGQELTEPEKKVFYSHPSSGYKFISRIPRMEKIAEAIKAQYLNTSSNDDSTREIIEMNKLLLDYDFLIQKGQTPLQVFEIMNKNKLLYNAEFLDALQKELLQSKDGQPILLVPLSGLRTGYIVAEDIKSAEGTDLVRKGTQISEVLLDRLIQFSEGEKIVEPIKVIEQFPKDNK